MYVEEINALHHRSSEEVARNLEQLLSGPRVGEESKIPHTAGAGTGAGTGGGADGDQSKSRSVEGDGGRVGDHDGLNTSQAVEEGKHTEPDAVLSTAFSFARITQVHQSPQFLTSPLLSSPYITSPLLTSPLLSSP